MVEHAQSQSRRFIFPAGLSSRQLYCSRNTSAVQMISFGQIQAVWQMIPLQIICKKPSAHTSTASSEHRCVMVCRDGCREARVILFVVAEVL